MSGPSLRILLRNVMTIAYSDSVFNAANMSTYPSHVRADRFHIGCKHAEIGLSSSLCFVFNLLYLALTLIFFCMMWPPFIIEKAHSF